MVVTSGALSNNVMLIKVKIFNFLA